jgi:hypothetical protein
MSIAQPIVSDMLITVKTREVQRGWIAEMAGRADEASRHLLAAAHLELVLAKDYEAAGEMNMARRSLIGAASCFWRAGNKDRAEMVFADLKTSDPSRASEVQEVIDDLTANFGHRKT